MTKRTSGVLLNISSLPGEFGIGGFSADALHFIDEMVSMGFHWWQVLPLTPQGLGDSPYNSYSAFAGNYLYIDPHGLKSEGLITDEEVDRCRYNGDYYCVNYDFVRPTKRWILEVAFSKITEKIKEEIQILLSENEKWLKDYALFMALKDAFNCPWWEFPKPLKFREKQALKDAEKLYNERIEFYYFEQYVFYKQWFNLKEHANKRGVGIFGDMPIYVALDSVDVWANTKLFELSKDLTPSRIAGVPPDYFAEEGQLWGNPLYDYKEMEKDNYSWWVERILHSLKLYDKLRIDHFIGFYKYWAVDKNVKSAKEGKWEEGVKHAIFNELKKKISNPNIVAEDLSSIQLEALPFLKETGFAGMRVMQFGFGDKTSMHYPHNYEINQVAYTGTHDTDTLLGWLYKLDDYTREEALKYCNFKEGAWGAGGEQCVSNKAFIRTLFASSAALAIVPMQDLCGFGSDTRMNIPGIATGNWRYRTNYSAMAGVDREFLQEMNRLYDRDNIYTE